MIEKNDNQLKCAPGVNYSEGSCFSLEQLIKITKKYNNKFNQNLEINLPKRKLIKQLISEIKKKIKCEGDSCLLKLGFLNKNLDSDIIKNTLRPKGPRLTKEWLSNVDINKVMNQYENKYYKFKYLGTVPSDFEEISYNNIDKLDFNSLLNRKKYKLGMVINLDKSNQKGSHWVSLYVNLKRKQIYFFDSVGHDPLKRIYNFMNKIYRSFTNVDINRELVNKKNQNDFDIRINKIQHQEGDSECGVYSMNFIIRSLMGESFDEITNNITKDKNMMECRKSYFR